MSGELQCSLWAVGSPGPFLFRLFLPSLVTCLLLLFKSYELYPIIRALTCHMIGILDNYRYPAERRKLLPVCHLRFRVNFSGKTLHPESNIEEQLPAGTVDTGCRLRPPRWTLLRRPVVEKLPQKAKRRLPTGAFTALAPGLVLRQFLDSSRFCR